MTPNQQGTRVKTILFAFWGRKANVELQLPYIHRILAEHPNVEFHGWDLSRDPRDARYLRTLTGERFKVLTNFYQGNGRASRGQTRVWQHYATREYRDYLFVKLDDDDVFLETDQFGAFTQAAQDNPGHIISALIINNGASTRHIPELWHGYQNLLSANAHERTIGKPLELLDVHLSAEYAEMCHRWFHTNWQTLIGGNTITPTDDWVSINAIALTWPILQCVAALLGTVPPSEIAGRYFSERNHVGDEGACNMLPRLIHKGFVVAHLNFGPQITAMEPETWTELRKLYADISEQYLMH